MDSYDLAGLRIKEEHALCPNAGLKIIAFERAVEPVIDADFYFTSIRIIYLSSSKVAGARIVVMTMRYIFVVRGQ